MLLCTREEIKSPMHDSLRSRLKQRLPEARDAAGYTQQALAGALGVEDRTVRSWEAGESFPRDGVLERMAKLLQVDPSWFLLPDTTQDDGPDPRIAIAKQHIEAALSALDSSSNTCGGKG